jgi:hypothetical protein
MFHGCLMHQVHVLILDGEFAALSFGRLFLALPSLLKIIDFVIGFVNRKICGGNIAQSERAFFLCFLVLSGQKEMV